MDRRHVFAEVNAHSMLVHKAQKRAAAKRMQGTRQSHKRTKQQRQAERDEIAAYLARVPPRSY